MKSRLAWYVDSRPGTNDWSSIEISMDLSEMMEEWSSDDKECEKLDWDS